MYSANLIPELTNTAHSCSRDCPATAWLTSERPGNVTHLPKTMLGYEPEYIVSRKKIISIKVTLYVFFYNLFLLKFLTLRAIG